VTSTFAYAGHTLDGSGTLTCRYELDGRPFVERVELGEGAWDTPWAAEAARLVHLVAGVSYFKTRAPGLIELDQPVRAKTLAMLRDLYRCGLGEFAYRNRLDLSGLEFRAEVLDGPPTNYAPPVGRALVPFGGGIDSIVTVETVKHTHPDSSLFVVSPPTQPFAAIERVVPVTGLPVVRVTRHLDPQLLKPAAESGFLQGHVPITGVLTAIGVLCAVGRGFEALVLSNEWSASDGNLTVDGQMVNHQYSKSRDFEVAFAAAVRSALGPWPSVFSLLRPFTEVWVAERFARLAQYHQAFHSCNRAFAVDPARRLDRWCGECDKCCFIDLVLSPFLSKVELNDIFDGREPLVRPDLFERFEVLVGLSPDPKPFECVGEVGECRASAVLGAERGDRRDEPLLQRLARSLPPVSPAEVATLLAPHHPHDIPDDFAPQGLLV
jgi:UDP-N-acetyl-alpha-D-muramoyl-L-alanyl-L-glutamate epimerase